jgi:hypothetical protein
MCSSGQTCMTSPLGIVVSVESLLLLDVLWVWIGRARALNLCALTRPSAASFVCLPVCRQLLLSQSHALVGGRTGG